MSQRIFLVRNSEEVQIGTREDQARREESEDELREEWLRVRLGFFPWDSRIRQKPANSRNFWEKRWNLGLLVFFCTDLGRSWEGAFQPHSRSVISDLERECFKRWTSECRSSRCTRRSIWARQQVSIAHRDPNSKNLWVLREFSGKNLELPRFSAKSKGPGWNANMLEKARSSPKIEVAKNSWNTFKKGLLSHQSILCKEM